MKENSDYWCKKKGLTLGEDILDPDGWDRANFEESWNEKITEAEFHSRLLMSTICYSLTLFK